MSNRSYCNPERQLRATKQRARLLVGSILACILACAPEAVASSADAPPWMHALVSAPLPSYDEKTDAVLLYSETNVTVISADKIRRQKREAYKILRPEGPQSRHCVRSSSLLTKVKSLHGWCIPAQGKDYEVKDKEAIEVSAGTGSADYVSDVKYKVLHIPAPDPGNIVGYEYEVEDQPIFLQAVWGFQETDPVRESRYSLQLPQGWEFKASWLNHPEVKPTEAGSNSWQWTLHDVSGIRHEPLMPPFRGVAGQMILSFFSSGTPALNANADRVGSSNSMGNLRGSLVSRNPRLLLPITRGRTSSRLSNGKVVFQSGGCAGRCIGGDQTGSGFTDRLQK